MKTCLENVPPKWDWDEEDMQKAIRPNWFHVRFFFLFCCLYREAMLAIVLGDWASVDAAFVALRTLSPSIASVLMVPVTEHVERLAEAARRRDITGVAEFSDGLEQCLAAAAEEHPHLEK